MTAEEFRAEHGDYTTWTDTDFNVYQDLVQTDVSTCWFCAAQNAIGQPTCGFCNHRADDAPDCTRQTTPAA